MCSFGPFYHQDVRCAAVTTVASVAILTESYSMQSNMHNIKFKTNKFSFRRCFFFSLLIIFLERCAVYTNVPHSWWLSKHTTAPCPRNQSQTGSDWDWDAALHVDAAHACRSRCVRWCIWVPVLGLEPQMRWCPKEKLCSCCCRCKTHCDLIFRVYISSAAIPLGHRPGEVR